MAKVSNIKQPAPAAAKPAPGKGVAFVAPSALSLDVGKRVVERAVESVNLDAKISDMTSETTMIKGRAIQDLFESFIKAAKNDPSITLAAIRGNDKAAKEILRQKLDVAIGIRVANRGEDGVDKITLADWTKNYWPQPGEDVTSKAWRVKENFRTNFSAMVRKATEAACTVVERNLNYRKNDKTGHLMISGPAIKERFNVDEITLDEQRVIETGEGKPTIKLAKIPSVSELARITSEKAAPKPARAPASREALTEEAILAQINSARETLKQIKKVGDTLADALESLRDEIDEVLDNRDSASAA